MPTERFSFTGHDGSALAARLDLPEGPVLANALFAHCFTCGKDIPAARRIAGRLSKMGIAVLRFDFTGLGHSEGEFANTNFASNVQDLTLAAQAMAARGQAPSILIGHSLGGAAVLRAGPEIPGLKAIATIGAPAEPAHVTHNFASALPEITEQGSAEILLGGRPIRISKSFVDDVQQTDLKSVIGKLKTALLVMHAPSDHVVSIDNATEIFVAAKHPKSFVTLDDADHLVTKPEHANYVAEIIAAWAGKYVGLAPPAPPPGAPEGVIRVTEADANGFLQDIQSGPGNHIYADEPVAYGGTNKGLTPYGLVSAGLGACTSMTIRMYARRKGWPLESVSVDVTHDKVHAQHTTPGESERLDSFSRVIRLRGDLDDTQKARLVEIADRCPVHRTLESVARVHTEVHC